MRKIYLLSTLVFSFYLESTAQPEIIGPELVCDIITNKIYQVNNPVATSSYQWEIDGGADIIGDLNGSSITLFITSTTTITVHELTFDSNEYSSILTVFIEPEPILNLEEITACPNINIYYNLLDYSLDADRFEWYALDNPNVEGETTDIQSSFIINDNITSTSDDMQVVEYQVTAFTPGGCIGEPSLLRVTLEPAPKGMDTSLTICSDVPFEIDLLDAISNGVDADFTWTATYPEGIFGGTDNGTGNINELLLNNTGSVLEVTYLVTPFDVIWGCTGETFNTIVTILPSPIPQSIPGMELCSGDNFSIGDFQRFITNSIQSNFVWTTQFPEGVTGNTTSGTEIIEDVLFNISSNQQTINYIIVPTATVSGCVGNAFFFTLLLNPEPTAEDVQLSSFCSDEIIEINPQEFIDNEVESTFSWQAVYAEGINGGTDSGIGVIQETLTNSTNTELLVEYEITPTSSLHGCLGKPFNLKVPINPIPNFSVTNNTPRIDSGMPIDLTVNSDIENIIVELYNIQFDGDIVGSSIIPVTFDSFPTTIDDDISNFETDSVQLIYSFNSEINGCIGDAKSETIMVAPQVINGLHEIEANLDIKINLENRQMQIGGLEPKTEILVTNLKGQTIYNGYLETSNVLSLDFSNYPESIFVVDISGQTNYRFKIFL